MRKLMMLIAGIGMAIMVGTFTAPASAADAGNYLKLPNPAQTLQPGLQFVGGYKYCDYNGCYYCSYRVCDDYDYRYGHRYCSHFSYSGCSSYHGGGYGGGYKKRRYYGGGGY